jgi:hypothetical protein
MTLPGLVAGQNLADIVDKERAWDNLGSNVSANMPIAPPSLDLNFAANRSLVDNVSGNNLITFSRSSTGTFVGSNGLIQTAASGVPRFDHSPVTGESLGLLIEEARANILVPSVPAATAPSTATNTLISGLPGIFSEARLITLTITADDQRIVIGTWPSSLEYTLSFYARKGLSATSQIAVRMGTGPYVNFNLVNGGAYTFGTFYNIGMTDVGNGWWRCRATIVGNGQPVNILVASNGGIFGNAGDSVIVTAFQLELGSFPTSYIPTSGTTVTRAADVAQITGSNFSSWYNQSQGSLYAFFRGGRESQQVGYGRVMSLGGTSALLSTNGTTNSLGAWFGGASLDFNGISGVDYWNTPNSAAVAYSLTSTIIVKANQSNTSNSAPSQLGTVTKCALGSNESAPGNMLNGTISRLTYYPVRLNNVALQYITSASGSSSSTTYPYSFTIKGRDISALNSVYNASTRDFVRIIGLTSPAQPRLTTAAQNTASTVALRNAAMLKESPITVGNYFFSAGVRLSGASTRINGTPALSIGTSPFSGSTATAPILLQELRPQTNWRITEPMPSGAIASPEYAIPFETNDFVFFMKAGPN